MTWNGISKKGIPLDMHHFMLRAKDTGDWEGGELVPDDVMGLLHDKIKAVDLENVKADVIPFIKDDAVLNIWSDSYFLDLIEKLKFQ